MGSVKIILQFPPSSNNAYPTVRRGSKLIRIKSKRMINWLKSAPPLDEVVSGPCIIKYKMYFPDKRIRDGQSYMKAPLDYIVSQGVIEDDNTRIVKAESWVDCGVDKAMPRVEVEIISIGKDI